MPSDKNIEGILMPMPVAFKHDGARGLRVPGEGFVEAQPGTDQAVGGEIGDLGPGQLDGAAAGNESKALVPPPTGVLGMRESQLLDLTDSARRESVAAHLFPGEGRFFEHRDVDACLGEVIRGGGPGGTRANYEYFHVVLNQQLSRTVRLYGGV